MGYESKLYVCDKHKHHDNNGKVVWTYLEKIAEFYMCKVDQEFFEYCFENHPIGDDWELYGDDGNTLLKEDEYGDKLTYASVESVLKVAEECESHGHYRRYVPLISFLKSIVENRNDWSDIIVIHYGY